MKMDMSQYLDVFLEESKEHLESLNQRLLDLEKDSSNINALNEIFRAAHTLKGMSSTMGFDDLADLTHHMENVLSDLKEGILPVNSTVIDTIFQCFDRLQMIIDQIEANGSGTMDNRDLINILENIKTGNFEAAATIEQEISTPTSVSIEENSSYQDSFAFNDYDITVLKEAASRNFTIYNIKIAVDQGCLMKAVRVFMVFKALEEDGEVIKSLPPAQDLDEGKFDSNFEIILISKATIIDLEKRLTNISEITVLYIQEISVDSLISQSNSAIMNIENKISKHSLDTMDSPRSHKVKQTVRVDIERLDNLMNLVGELVMHKGRLEQIGFSYKIGELNETIEQIDRISTDLQSVVMKVRMVPIEQVFNRFPRMVRDLARDLNKEVDFLIEGKETELDRTVIDEIGDPLVHLLRNAIDHGLESSQERLKKGKVSKGTVLLRARHEGNNVYIEVEDDGGGIDTDRVLAKAVEKGILTSRDVEQLSREEAIELLFNSGFSTAQNITDISGRGVGLDVVKNKI
ncbi:MAG: chemotaxis protein CheA, partial [Methanocorpusculum sp.]|nr:chemotaxis protein CheA [Methanocorpusculum sp.]